MVCDDLVIRWTMLLHVALHSSLATSAVHTLPAHRMQPSSQLTLRVTSARGTPSSSRNWLSSSTPGMSCGRPGVFRMVALYETHQSPPT